MNQNLKQLFILITLYVVFQSIYIDKFSLVWEDESWYANTAYNIASGRGFVNTNVGEGGDSLVLFPLLLSLSYIIFGFSLTLSRIVSIFFGLIGLIFLFKSVKILKLSKTLTYLTIFIYIFSNVNYVVFRTVRPESLVLCLEILTIYFFIKGVKNERKKYSSILVGICSSFAFLAHPDGGIISLSFGLIYLIIGLKSGEFHDMFRFILGVIPALILLLLFVVYVKDTTLLDFFSPWLSRSNFHENSNFIDERMNNISLFITNYTLGWKRGFIFFIELLIPFIGIVRAKKNSLTFYLSIVAVAIALFHVLMFSKVSTRSFGEYTILSLIVMILLLKDLNFQYMNWKLGLMVVFLVNNLAGDIYVLIKNRNNTPYEYVSKLIEECVFPRSAVVVSQMNLWFALHKSEFYGEYTRWWLGPYSDISNLLNTDEWDYIVISDYEEGLATGTSGRKSDGKFMNRQRDFKSIVLTKAYECGELIKTIGTQGYSEIHIYKNRKKTSQ